jgi:FMN phosphatase YigB (HAD superfamily)
MTNEKSIQLVTFDLYDTLIELEPPRWARMQAVLERRGITSNLASLKQGDLAGRITGPK